MSKVIDLTGLSRFWANVDKRKANKDGVYSNLIAGDLAGRGESVPAEFSFRASGGKSIKDGTAWIKRLKGNSVVWNNIAEWRGVGNTNYGITVTFDNGYIHVQGVAENTAIPFYSVLYDDASKSGIFIKNHRYMVSGKGDKFYLSIYGDVSITGPNVITEKTGESVRLTISSNNLTIGEEINETFPIRVVDLTQMFQAGNEPTTIEEYEARKPIVEDEYAYNEGEVIHMTAEGIKSVGDNAWDEEWELGTFNITTGEEVDSVTHFRAKNYIRVIPNTQYYFAKPIGVLTYLMFYDESKNFVKWLDPFATSGSGGVFTTPNAPYMRFMCANTTYNHDIMITLVHSGWKQDTDAGYQPYWEDRLIFDQRIKDEFPNGMQKWDMVYNKDGKGYIVKGTGSVDMGSLSYNRLNVTTEGVEWYYFISNNLIGIAQLPQYNTVGNALSPMYNLLSAIALASREMSDKSMMLYSQGPQLYFRNDAYTDAATFKAAMAGVPLYYQLAEPTIIEYDEPFNLDYKVADFGTEQAIAEQPSAPISADIIYQFNAVDMIREHEIEIAELQSIIATMQAQLASLTSNNG